MVISICEFCKKEFVSPKKRRFCHYLCQRKHYNRSNEIREKYKLRMREYRKNHPEWKEKHRIQQAKYKEKREIYRKEYFQRPEVKKRMNDYMKAKLRNNPEHAIASRLRKSLRHALEKYSNTGKIMSSKKYGVDWKIVIERLKPFPKDIENYEIDHIIPLRTFNLTNSEEVRKAFAPENLQWLTKYENRSKGGKLQFNSISKDL